MGDESIQPLTPSPPEPSWSDEVLNAGCLCPPADAKACAGALYRYVESPKDWQTYVGQGKSKKGHSAERRCDDAALSCFSSVERLAQTMKMREAFSGTRIVKALLTSDHGVMKPTPPDGHVSLWLRRKFAASPQALFVPHEESQ